MERRREPRISSNQPVWLTVYGQNEVRCLATTMDISSRGMKLMVAWRFPQDASVKIELIGKNSDDILYLGEICYCRPELGGFIIGIEVHQVITGLRDLAQLQRSVAEGVTAEGVTKDNTAGQQREPLSKYADTASGDDEYRQLRKVDRSRV